MLHAMSVVAQEKIQKKTILKYHPRKRQPSAKKEIYSIPEEHQRKMPEKADKSYNGKVT